MASTQPPGTATYICSSTLATAHDVVEVDNVIPTILTLFSLGAIPAHGRVSSSATSLPGSCMFTEAPTPLGFVHGHVALACGGSTYGVEARFGILL